MTSFVFRPSTLGTHRRFSIQTILFSISIALPIGLAFPTGQGASADGPPSSIQQRLKSDLEYLASDQMRGRGIGTPELDQAAEYVRDAFAAAGLQLAIYDDGPFQSVKLPGRVKLGAPEENTLAFQTDSSPSSSETVNLELDVDFRPLAIGGSAEFEAPLVFAGFGITAPEFEYDDYAEVDVKGKAVLIIRKEPQQKDRKSVFKGRAHTKHAHFRTKIENAVRHGATAVILVNDRHEIDSETQSLRSKWKQRLEQLTDEQSKLDEIPTDDSDSFAEHRERVLDLSQKLEELAQRLDTTDVLPAFEAAGTASFAKDVPVFFVRRQVANDLLMRSLGKPLREFEDRLDELIICSQPLPETRVMGQASLPPLEARNVLAVIEGQGPLAEETVILGAHYDHVGMGGSGSMAPWTRAIHNGADDNASGIVALLEVARQIKSHSEAPQRRIVFIAFSAEEIGLLGSQHYVRDPRYPLNKTVAMLNLDMVGRLGDQALTIQGLDTAEEFPDWMEQIATRTQLQFKNKPGGAGPSDHAPFFEKEIPVMHFFSGLHRDYHRPTDDVDKIDIEGLEKVTNTVTQVALKIANAESRPTFRSKGRPSKKEKAADPESKAQETAPKEPNQDEKPAEEDKPVAAPDDSPADQTEPDQTDAPDSGEDGDSEPTDRSSPESP